VLVAIGRSGDRRRLGVPGEAPPRVYHRLHDARDFRGRDVLVAGGGDSAAEAAIALAGAGARVTLAHRSATLVRPNGANLAALRELERAGALTVLAGARVSEVRERDVLLADGRSLPNDVVFALLGREAPLGFLRRSRVPIRAEMTAGRWLAFAGFVAFMAWFDDWKAGGFFAALWQRRGWFPFDVMQRCESVGGALAAAARDPRTLAGTLAISATGPAFWGTLLYTLVVIGFGLARIRRRRTPYVTAQTWTLMLVQVLPLFVLPEIVLPWLGHNGRLPAGFADALFPAVNYGHGREYWRAYGFIFAFPLDVYNILTDRPLPWWLVIGAVQTLVLIPLVVWLWGKGAYCGWFCSCGGLAETLGDTHRHKMPHGPGWNRLNLAGQVLLALSVVLLLVRVAGWLLPEGNWIQRHFMMTFLFGWKWIVDIVIGSVIGVGFYFWYSGRVWCRFFCPLAAWMHVLARFSRFAILAEKPKCISCNQCTAQCHMGIDVMSFAQRGEPMRDPECVRCSACVETCPTGVLQFGSVRADGTLISVDSLLASPVRGREAARGAARRAP
jgi:NAD-dependent dihydropyrimidine dehydrogenase PreA subunit